MTDWMTVD